MKLFILKLLMHILYSYLILAKDFFICLQQHVQIEFFPKLIVKVPHNGSFDAQMKTPETIEHAQTELFILIIRIPHVSSTDVYIRAI